MTIRRQITCLGVGLFVMVLGACAPMGEVVPVTGETAAAAGTPSGSVDLPPKAVQDAQRWLAEQLSVAVEQVEIISVEPVEWTDSCLGLGLPNESCLRAATPGWRAIFEINGQSYEVRTDETGSVIRMAP